MVLSIENDGTSDPLMDFNLGNFAIECEPSIDFPIAEIQAESHQPQTWSTDCFFSHIEEARLMRLALLAQLFLQTQQNRDSTSTTSATTPAARTWDNSIYHTPPSFLEHSVPARSVPGADELRLRTSTPLSPSRSRNQPVPTPSSRKLERIREEQEKTPERDARPAQDGTVLHARRGRDGTYSTRSPDQNPSTSSSNSKPPSTPAPPRP
ncbi:hypothetical protein PSTG_18263, partial [Puccinia striiformis f. sp. tritici PST-78]